ncbi:hypothetical protein D3C78_1646570 [compost metagenome]
MLAASSSPSVSASRWRPLKASSISPSAMKGRHSRTSSKLRSASEPMSHSTMSCMSVGVGARLMARAVSAAVSEDMATPARIKVRLLAPFLAMR